MRILSIISSLAESGGAEMLARNLSLDLVARGHACTIAYISDAAALGIDAQFENDFKRDLERAGIGHVMLGHGCRRNPLLGAWRLRRTVRAFAPDVIHTHLGWGLLFQSLAALRRPTVYTHHNIVLRFSPRLFPIFDRFVDRYIAICGPCGALLARHVGKPIRHIPNGVPVGFATRASRGAAERALKVLSVGNLTAQKNYPGLVEAAARILPAMAARGRTVSFDIAGEGPERAAIEADIERRGLGGHMRLLGARRDVAELMADADLLVLASWFEGLPISLIEAAMSGLPVVATDVGGCGDVVAAGESGLLVPPGDPGALAGAVTELLLDGERRAAFGAAARVHGQRFTLRACADAHIAQYEEAIAAHARRPPP